jgi:hypothetical protein
MGTAPVGNIFTFGKREVAPAEAVIFLIRKSKRILTYIVAQFVNISFIHNSLTIRNVLPKK